MDKESRSGVLLGAHGGIGRALLTQFSTDASIEHIEATHRIPLYSEGEAKKVSWRTLDLECADNIQRNTERWCASLPSLDFVVCAAGVLHDGELKPEKRMQQLREHNMHRLFQINAAGPLAVLAGLEPLLKKSHQPKVMVLSAQVGSIADNHLGGWYSYRMSKAALNMGLKTFAIEAARWRNDAVVMAVHPGTTLSQLSAPFVRQRKAPVRQAAETAAHLDQLLKHADSAHHGGFFTAQGERLPW